MRIDNKRASEYSTEQIKKMLESGVAWDSLERLTAGQTNELKKVLAMRKESK